MPLVIQVTGAGAFDANGFGSSDGFTATWAKAEYVGQIKKYSSKTGIRVPGELFSYLWTMLGTKKCSGPHNSRQWLFIPASQHNQTISPLGWLVTSQSHGNVPSCLQYNTILPCAASSRYFLTELIPSCRCANMNWTKNGHCCHGESLLLIPVIIQATGGAEKGSVAGVLTSTNVAGKQQLQRILELGVSPEWFLVQVALSKPNYTNLCPTQREIYQLHQPCSKNCSCIRKMPGW